MKQPNEMSNSEIDTELALNMGWHKVLKEQDGDLYIGQNNQVTGWSKTGHKYSDTWHPTSSLDQCHLIEDYLDELRETNHRLTCIPALRYADHLRIIVGAKGKLYFAYDLIHATARQKAEALLMTLREVEE